MTFRFLRWIHCWSVALGLLVWFPALVQGQTSPEEFFEKKIRPILAENCYECHSAQAKKVRGGLLLDSRDGVRKGGDNGPALIPGQPEKSLILEALRHDGLKMPPKSKLAAAVIADFETWIRSGAIDPRDKVTAKRPADEPYDYVAAGRHWAFQPIRKPPLPAVKNTSWPISPLDTFLLANLEAKGLTPSPPADRRTLLRRVTFDLIGLPPTQEEVEAFVNDPSSDAFAKVVDRLLQSPHYGERWGRHWLDVARYADTKDGVLMFGDSRIRPFAYTYRDYVIRALNEDVPFDRFIHEQLAADHLYPVKGNEVGADAWRLAAMGFLTLGRMFDNNVHDVLDDRIDVVSRGLLGLTVSCARCHNHKYDPIPMADYYSLYGVFAGCEQPLELPLIDAPNRIPGGEEFEKGAGPKRKELQSFLDKQYALLSDQARLRVGDYLMRVATTKPDPLESAIFFLSLAPQDLRPPIVARWRRYLELHARPEDPVFGLWHTLGHDEDVDRQRKSFWRQLEQQRPPGVEEGQVNPLVLDAILRGKPATKAGVARIYGDLLRTIYEESKKASPVTLKSWNAPKRQLLDLIVGHDSPAYFPHDQTRRYMSRGDTDAFGGKMTELDKMTVKAAGAPPRAMVLFDAPEPFEPRVFLRGNPIQAGDRVPRQFLRVLSGPKRAPFDHGSGRLDLAKAIASVDNPLTSRVLVNRVWMNHFGEPLVATPSDFGVRSAPPIHPELLDYLAFTFMENDWSLKKLHRQIVLSAAYQQASRDRPDCRQIDSDNSFYWRMNRRRLDLEAMRDALLFVSGRLDAKLGGRPVDVAGDALNRRRTVYALIDRQSLPALFRTFDFAVPDQSVERRSQTTVPQQALFGMNSPFMLEQAKALIARPEIAREESPPERIAALYRLLFARPPEPEEMDRGLRFVSSPGKWQQYAHVLLLTNEMLFVD